MNLTNFSFYGTKESLIAINISLPPLRIQRSGPTNLGPYILNQSSQNVNIYINKHLFFFVIVYNIR